MRDSDLDDLFAEARRESPAPSADLMMRILADAAAEMPVRPAPVRAVPRRPERSRLLALFGGGGLFAGLATATLVGVWIGVAQPPVAEALWIGTAGGQLESVDLVPGYELFASLDAPVEG
ncbi:dihydroorotate dehydrogenase [Cereibacter sediminicola]|uniref:dihydroorotate dehydrogenase n=1 Tax=Cereibacter sediminicola TaxID=2584941 RepID=UPI0011A8E015|nr:dihydroorotate dehydrogenase [Cereibacter sediminicola]